MGYTLFFYYVGEREGIIKCQQWSDATRGRDAIFVSGSLAAGWTEPLAAWAALFFHFGVYSLKSWEASASWSVTPGKKVSMNKETKVDVMSN